MSEFDDGDSILANEISSALQKFIDLNTNKLFEKPSSKDIEILNYYLKNPDKIIRDYYNHSKDKSNSNERTISRHIQQLVEDGYLEFVIEKRELITGMKKKYKKPYRLTLSGIFYLILNTEGISSYIDTIRNIVKNYKENHLFTIFLYPIIKEETIDEIEYDVSFFSVIVGYLKEVCQNIAVSINRLKSKEISDDGYLMNRIFIWPNNPGCNLDIDLLIDNLRFFLKTTLKWSDVENLEIIPNIQENTIELIDAHNSPRNSVLTILERDRSAVLRQNGKMIYKFSITPNEGFLIVESKSNIRAIDEIKSPFLDRYEEQLIRFLTNLRTGLIQSTSLCTNRTFDILSKDERYQKALKYLGRKLNFKQ